MSKQSYSILTTACCDVATDNTQEEMTACFQKLNKTLHSPQKANGCAAGHICDSDIETHESFKDGITIAVNHNDNDVPDILLETESAVGESAGKIDRQPPQNINHETVAKLVENEQENTVPVSRKATRNTENESSASKEESIPVIARREKVAAHPVLGRRRKISTIERPVFNTTDDVVEIQQLAIGTRVERQKKISLPNIAITSVSHGKWDIHGHSRHPALSAHVSDQRWKDDETKSTLLCPVPPQHSKIRRSKSADCHKRASKPKPEDNDHDDFHELKFRPRLRSQSLDDIQQKEQEPNEIKMHEKTDKNCRRKSFEVWLTDKEKQILQEMTMKAMKREQEAKKESMRRKSCHGKTYEEWLKDKARHFEVHKHSLTDSRCHVDNENSNERRRMSQDRYDKWLFEKEMQALRQEQQKLQETERKAMELRRKYLEQ